MQADIAVTQDSSQIDMALNYRSWTGLIDVLAHRRWYGKLTARADFERL